MRRLGRISKILLFLTMVFLAIASFLVFSYIILLPKIISSPKTVDFIEGKVLQFTGFVISLKNPEITTDFSTIVKVRAKEFALSKNNKNLIFAKNLNSTLSLKKIFDKTLKIEDAGADNIFIDITALIDSLPEQKEKQEFQIDFYDTMLYVKDVKLSYDISSSAKSKIEIKNLTISKPEFARRNVTFDAKGEIYKNGKTIKLSLADEGKTFIRNNKIFADNVLLKVDNSKILTSFFYGLDNSYDITVVSKKFNITDIIKVIESNILENNLNSNLAYFSDIGGNIDFRLNYDNSGLTGKINLNRLMFKMKYLYNLPIVITNGYADISKKKIKLNDFKGYYYNNLKNKIDFSGEITDYFKTFNTNVVGNAVITNDFAKSYLSKALNTPLEIQGKADTRIMLKFVNNITDLVWLYKFDKGCGFTMEGEEFGPMKTERVLVSDMHIDGPILNIKSINYFIGSPKDEHFHKKPILTFYGNVDLANNGNLKNFGFKIPEYLTSRFVNLIIKNNMFRKGMIKGNLEVINEKIPVLNGHLSIEKMAVPSQRMFIKTADLTVKDNIIKITSNGKYKRSDYDISGEILNQIVFPIIVKNVNLKIDNIDVERFINGVNNQANAKIEEKDLAVDNTETAEDVPTFDLSNIIVEKCNLNLVKGVYKELKFGNVSADLTFDKNGILKIVSNRFDIAEGISSAKIFCDLKNQKYSLKLGVKDVNADIISTALFGIKKEISGKAGGFIRLNTDKTLALNGNIRFGIKNGTIMKIGMVEYILKFASVFRNPLAMLSPTVFWDLVNVKDGNFDKILGSLTIENNVISDIKITSSAPELSSFIIGRYDLLSSDASLRIYIKFSNKRKGIYGIMRNISLNSLANKMPFGLKSNHHYYKQETDQIPKLADGEEDCQIFLTKVDGDVEHNNFISSLIKIK